MAIREKLRKTFGKNKGSISGDSTPSKASSTDQYYTGRTDIEYYKPNEIPKSKYRGRVDKAHQEQLEAYSFADAFTQMRRRSSQALSGIMSPGGTKAQSRRPSYVSRASKTTRGSISSQGGFDADGQNVLSRSTTPGLQAPNPNVPRVDEGSDEESSLTSVDKEKFDSSSTTAYQSQESVPTVRLDRTATVVEEKSSSPHFNSPFTATELERAMTKATLRGNVDVPAHRSSIVAH